MIREVERFARSQRFRITRQLQEENMGPTQNILRENISVPSIPDFDLVEDSKRRLLFFLFFINGSIFLIAGGLGYFLAGKTLKPIQDMLSEQNQFITDASHELRTPLTAIKCAIEVHLRDKKLTIPKAQKLLAENIRDVNRLQKLSDQLLELAQYEKPNGNGSMSAVSIKDSIQKAVQRIEPLAKAKSISLQTHLTDGIVNGHMQEITDLIVILIDNAIKYSAQKSKITITSEKQTHHISFTVRDHGIGIKKNDIGHIFDRFFRADTTRQKTHTSGYGLGLSIAQKIVWRHNGTLLCESVFGKGSAFIVTLPTLSQ